MSHPHVKWTFAESQPSAGSRESQYLCLLKEPFQFCGFSDAKKYKHLSFTTGYL